MMFGELPVGIRDIPNVVVDNTIRPHMIRSAVAAAEVRRDFLNKNTYMEDIHIGNKNCHVLDVDSSLLRSSF